MFGGILLKLLLNNLEKQVLQLHNNFMKLQTNGQHLNKSGESIGEKSLTSNERKSIARELAMKRISMSNFKDVEAIRVSQGNQHPSEKKLKELPEGGVSQVVNY